MSEQSECNCTDQTFVEWAKDLTRRAEESTKPEDAAE
jgi:hypothetical protein